MRDADFVCLQEVDHFEDCYKAKLTELGFSVQYAQQPWVDGDGSLIAWNPAVWKPCTLEKLEFDRCPEAERNWYYAKKNVRPV